MPPKKSTWTCAERTGFLISYFFGLCVILLAAGLISSVIVVCAHVMIPLQTVQRNTEGTVVVVASTWSWSYFLWTAGLCVISFGVVFHYIAALSISPNRYPPNRWETLIHAMRIQQMEAAIPNPVQLSASPAAAVTEVLAPLSQTGAVPPTHGGPSSRGGVTPLLSLRDALPASVTPLHTSDSFRKSGVTYCQSCNRLRFPRARHCMLCGTCVQRMDHHCPWINNCVGHENFRYFYLFLFWLFLGTAFCGLQFAMCYTSGRLGGLDTEEHFLERYFSLFELKEPPRSPFVAGDLWHATHASASLARETYGKLVDTDLQRLRASYSTGLFFELLLCGVLWIAMAGFVGWFSFLSMRNLTSMEYNQYSVAAVSSARRSHFTPKGKASFFFTALFPAQTHWKYDLGWLYNLASLFGVARDRRASHILFAVRHRDESEPFSFQFALVALLRWVCLPVLDPLWVDGTAYELNE